MRRIVQHEADGASGHRKGRNRAAPRTSGSSTPAGSPLALRPIEIGERVGREISTGVMTASPTSSPAKRLQIVSTASRPTISGKSASVAFSESAARERVEQRAALAADRVARDRSAELARHSIAPSTE